MTSQGEQSLELFCVFSELRKIGGVEDEQARVLLCFVSCWEPQQHPYPRYKQFLKGYFRPL